MAFHVRKMPIGASMNAEMKAPENAPMAPSRASLVPEMSTTQYSTKNSTETMALVPSPPLRIREPSGAPIKKRMKQARACANFFRSSMSVCRM